MFLLKSLYNVLKTVVINLKFLVIVHEHFEESSNVSLCNLNLL